MITVYLREARDAPVKEVLVGGGAKVELGTWIDSHGAPTPRTLECKDSNDNVLAAFRIEVVLGYQVQPKTD